MLPLFPLPVVLFPGALLPLHIFEPRYRALLADAVAGDHRFGLLPPGDPGDPPVGSIGSVARIRAIQPLPEGRSHIVVSGESRFRLRRLMETDKSYLVAEIDPFDDEPDVQIPTADQVATLDQLGARYAAALAALEDGERDVELAAEPGLLSFQIAGLLEWDFETKIHFLEIRSAASRLTHLLHILPKLVERLEARAGVHRRAATNGSGHR